MELLPLLWSPPRYRMRLKVSDFHQDGEEATIRLHEKGDRQRTISLHFAAADAIREYLSRAELKSGPLFRP